MMVATNDTINATITSIASTASANSTISDDDEEFEVLVSRVVAVFFGFIGITGFIGNCSVVLVVLSNKQMRSTTNILIINLAFADLLFVVFCIPFTATDYIISMWPFGEAWCKIVQYLIVVTAHASIYTLVLMSLDRFLAVVHPISSMGIRNERHTWFAIIILWLVIITTAVPVSFSHGIKEYTYQERLLTSCIFLESGQFSWAAFHIAFFLSSYLIPLVLISGLYVWMLTRLWHSGVGGHRVSAESKKGKKRVTRMVVVVVAAFASLWFPIQVILVLKSWHLFTADTHFKIALQIISHALAYSSSCINPLLYAFLSENFRKAFRKIVYCGPNSSSRSHRNHQPLPTKTTRTGSVPDIL